MLAQTHKSLLQTPLAQVLRTTPSHLGDLKAMNLHTIEDLFHYFPRTYRDQTELISIAELRTDVVNVVRGQLTQMFTQRTRAGKTMTRAVLVDSSGFIEVLWFNQPHLQRLFRNGDEVILTGKIRFERGKVSFLSPGYEVVRQKQLHTARLVPVYPEHGKVTSKWLREKIHPLLKGTQLLTDPLPQSVLTDERLLPYSQAIRAVHDPQNEEQLNAARERLAFDELFFLQLDALERRERFRHTTKNTDRVIDVKSHVSEEFHLKLPFPLTSAQKGVIDEISKDLQLPYPMMRLLQGDVGSGKTVVAAFALYHVMRSGMQGALMAPTEILAKQHYETLIRLLGDEAFNIQFLSGSLSVAQKKEVYRQIATGTVDLVIGTHALIQDGVQFLKLRLVVIDEQHRFGVRQREHLMEQGSPHVLSLSATPIPRTLAMVIYGDQDVSILDELPPGRQEIITRIVPEYKRRDAEFWIADQIQKRRQVFIVCPLIDESDLLGVKAVTAEFERLQKEVFKNFKIGLLHGKLKPSEKEAVMADFSAGRLHILVSTSVIEVGIDVPNATIMLIEGAERFGLSQLHQFRGRVGRGQHQSYCFLFTDSFSETNLERLKAMVHHSNGFQLAEIDLQLRGPGEVYGVRQSGIPDLKMASFSDSALIQRVRQAVSKHLTLNS